MANRAVLRNSASRLRMAAVLATTLALVVPCVPGAPAQPALAANDMRAAPTPPVSAPRGTGPGAGSRIKIPIGAPGLYRLSAAEIAAKLTGLSQTDVESRIAGTNLSLTCQGSPVSWLAEPGATGLLFYAFGTDSRYTATNIYWLTPAPGVPMTVQTGAPPAAVSTSRWYRATVHAERNLLASVAAGEDPEEDYWTWQGLICGHATVGTVVLTTQVDAVSSAITNGAQAELSVQMKGLSALSANPEYRALVSLNSVILSTNLWNDHERVTVNVRVPNLVTGNNRLTVKGEKPPGVLASESPAFAIDWFELSYPRYYQATSNALWCTGNTNAEVTVTGYSSPSIRVLDVTDPFLPVLRADTTVDTSGAGSHRVTFSPASPTNRYLAVAAPATRRPSGVRGRTPADLDAVTNAADHLTIVAAGFESTVAPLVERRRSQGLVARSVQVEDVYDLFSHGLVTPWAIRDFLRYAVDNWSNAPEYVVLAGCGSYDYRQYHYRGTNTCALPPPMVYVPSYGLRTSDAPLADLDGDRAPDVALGRLHCQTTQELAGAIAKIASYEQDADWRVPVRFTASLYDASAGNFSQSCERVAALVPGYKTPDRNYRDTQTVAQVKTRLVAGINQGAHLVWYFGHGTPDKLSTGAGQPNETYLAKTDLAAFTNRYQAPLMCAMTCDFAYFGAPNSDRLGEGLVSRPAGGVSGLLGSVAPTYNFASEAFGELLARRIYTDRSERFGDAMVAAMSDYRDSGPLMYVLDVINFLGDPATTLGPYPAPTLVALGEFSSEVHDGQVVVLWTTTSESGSVGFFLERLDPASGRFVLVNQALIPAGLDSVDGAAYEVADAGAPLDAASVYRLIEVEVSGRRHVYGPFTTVPSAGDAASGEVATAVSPVVVRLAAGQGHLLLRWRSRAGQVYTLERGARAGGPFETLASGIAADPPENSIAIVERAPAAFYRIRVE